MPRMIDADVLVEAIQKMKAVDPLISVRKNYFIGRVVKPIQQQAVAPSADAVAADFTCQASEYEQLLRLKIYNILTSMVPFEGNGKRFYRANFDAREKRDMEASLRGWKPWWDGCYAASDSEQPAAPPGVGEEDADMAGYKRGFQDCERMVKDEPWRFNLTPPAPKQQPYAKTDFGNLAMHVSGG